MNISETFGKEKGLEWHVVERALAVEKAWILKSFDFGQENRKHTSEEFTASLSRNEMLRQIGLLILRGTIRARELVSEKPNGLWSDDLEWSHGHITERHGGEWHRAMMSIIKKHFEESGFKVVNEPALLWGRADLGVYKEGYKDILIEIGSTSLFKTWVNTHMMRNCLFLFVPSTTHAIEFDI